MVTIVNTVGSGDLGRELDLERVKDDIAVLYAEYNPSNYHGLYVRIVEQGPLITVYRSGKYIISGCPTLDELEEMNERFLGTLIDLGVLSSPYDTDFTVQNIVCTDQLHREINLHTLAVGLGLESVEYEPEQFPGLIFRPKQFPAVLLIFANGKVVITGAADVEIAETAFGHLQTKVTKLLGE